MKMILPIATDVMIDDLTKHHGPDIHDILFHYKIIPQEISKMTHPYYLRAYKKELYLFRG